MDPSYEKLVWNTKGIFEKIKVLMGNLEARKDALPDQNTREIGRIEKWISQLKSIDQGIEILRSMKLNMIEEELGYRFPSPELFILAHIQPSVRNVFDELRIFHENHPNVIELENEDFTNLLNLHEAAKVLALIGDAVISVALVHIHWDPSISRVGALTDVKKNYASNHRFGKICDRWGLYDLRIHEDQFTPEEDKKIDHTKGTIVEALFGIIYVESGLTQVISSIRALK